MKLAEEYRAALGETALDAMIRRLVTDDQWLPSELHSQLLSLPWADVLTTNWDTLLERTSLDDPDRSYDVVRTVSDIARTRAPRIVKLHGSLPSHKPFIFTAEDFRTYPRRFSAFINLAQQVLLENELCLVGFSGDDPNFLQWAGWVRDQLGENARRIRLVGDLRLSSSQRQVLEQRNIYPIDLSPLVVGLERDEAHQRATEIFINELWAGEPKPAHSWNRTRLANEPPLNATPTEIIEQLVQSWTEDHKCYPGWVIAPAHHREFLDFETGVWSRHMRQALPQVNDRLRALACYELVWRYEVALQPLDSFLFDIVGSTLESGCGNLSKRQLVEVADFLAAQARHFQDEVKCRKWLGYLAGLGDPEADLRHRYHEALIAKRELNFVKLAEILPDLNGDDPVWKLRAASLYCDLQENELAARMIMDALGEIRGRRSHHRSSIWLLSREAWASWLWYSAKSVLPEKKLQTSSDRWSLRYHETDCDPWSYLSDIDKEIVKRVKRAVQSKSKIEPKFDAGSYVDHSQTVWFGDVSPAVPIYKLVRMAETVGIPREIKNSGLLGDRVGQLVEAYSDAFEPHIAWLAIEHIWERNKGLIDLVFDRVGVAHLSQDAVNTIIARLRAAIDYALDKLASGADEWLQPVAKYVELISRLVIRQEPDRAKELFLWGASLSRHRGLSHWTLANSLGRLLTRSLEAIPSNARSGIAVETLRFPLPSEHRVRGPEYEWPEPSLELSREDFTHRGLGWENRIRELINSVGADHELSRMRAVLRLSQLEEAGVLTEDERRMVADAVWGRIGAEGLPQGKGIFPHVFLMLPEPSPGISSDAFRKAVVEPVIGGAISAERLIAIEGAHSVKFGRPFRLSPQDALAVFKRCLKWSPPQVKSGFDRLSDDNRNGAAIIKAMGGCLTTAVIPYLVPASLDQPDVEEWVRKVEGEEVPTLLATVPHIPRLFPQHVEWATRILRKKLVSRHEPTVLSALNAIFQFVKIQDSGQGELPHILCSDVIGLCAARREPGLYHSLATARVLLERDLLTEDDKERLHDALDVLSVDLDYVRWNRSDPRTKVLSLLRASCFQLAALFKAKGVETDVVNGWLEAAARDPFPEVRFATLVTAEEMS
ncbi:SIR2 family NAD-dependent protein deacylase [Rhizobium laguerreae]|uniref:SIR2 family NAD-dependent protein deacylase n=1 Tax=Rhizobium laguerreae TaxID=1076926 RepID=UPI001441765C|nr:SIR2 family protein [Rhizobium laguerreae]